MGTQRIRKNDLLLFFGLLLLSAILAGGIWLRAGLSEGGTVVVTQDGVEIARYALKSNLTFTVESADGGKNVVVIQNGTCMVREADCPDGICVRRGRISRNGEAIVCLPHRLVISVTGAEEAEVDTIAQ